MEDPAWACIRMWRFGNDAQIAGGLAGLDDIRAGYEAAGGTWDDDRLLWWRVCSTLRWAVAPLALDEGRLMDFDLPKELTDYLVVLDEFIEREIKPLEAENDNIRFFDHRREDARADWDRGGLPNHEWEALLGATRRRADAAGHYRYPFPKQYGGQDGTNLGMAVIREHLASKGLGLHRDLQNEHAIVVNNVGLLLMINYGTDEQKATWIDDLANGRSAFCLRHHRTRTRLRCNPYGDGCSS